LLAPEESGGAMPPAFGLDATDTGDRRK